MINHENYRPSPHDMMIAMKAIADITQEITGRTPTIKVGPHRLYPPTDGQPLDEKAAQAFYSAMYEGKGTISVNDKNVPVFRQSQGQVTKDDYQLQTKMAPTIVSPENEAAKQKYQDYFDFRWMIMPENVDKFQMSYEDRLKLPVEEQKAADKMVMDLALQDGLSPEEFSLILGQGSAYVNSNLEAVASEIPQVSEGIQYLAAMDSEYRTEFLKEAIVEPEPVLSTIEPTIDPLENSFVYIPPDNTPDFSDTILARSYARMDGVGQEINKLYERASEPGHEFLIASGTPEAPSEADRLREQFAEAKASFDARLEVLGNRRSGVDAPVVTENYELVPDMPEVGMSEGILEEAINQDVMDLESAIETLPDLRDISRDLTPDQRFAPPQESLEQTISQLTAKIEALQTEMSSIRAKMDKIAQKEPVVKIRSWAQNKIDSVVGKIQDRIKVDSARTINLGKDFAQKAMDEIGNKLDQFQNNLLGLDKIHSDLKNVFEIHDNAPSVAVGEYTLNNDAGNISINHKDRGEVFSVTDKGASFVGKFNSNDYRMLSNVSEAVAVLAGPAAIAAEVAKDLAVGAVKGAVNEGAQKSAIRMG